MQTARYQNVGIAVYFIKIGQYMPKIWLFPRVKFAQNARVPPASPIPYIA